MSLKQKQYVVLVLMGIGLILIMTGAVKAWGFIEGSGFFMMIFGFAADFALLRCPRCGVWLGKYPGEYCQSCGKKIDWNDPAE